MNVRRRALLAGAALAAVSAVALSGCDRLSGHSAAPAFHSTDITGAEFARQFTLPDADGKVHSLADWKGKAVVVFFGYTQCPDFCPTTLAQLAAIRKSLGAEGDRVQVVFITVDPERDTPAVLKAYVSNFGPGVIGLRGTPEQIAQVAREFKVFYAKVPGAAPGSYTVDHSAASYVFDPEGRVRLYVQYGADSKAVASDLKLLLAA